MLAEQTLICIILNRQSFFRHVLGRALPGEHLRKRREKRLHDAGQCSFTRIPVWGVRSTSCSAQHVP